MTPTYDPIASTTLTLPAISVTFSSLDTIAAGYRDLVLVCSATGTPNGDTMNFRINGATSGYTWVTMEGDGSNATSTKDFAGSGVASIWLGGNDIALSSTTPNAVIIQVMDFAATDKHKTVLIRANNTSAGGGSFAIAGRYASTSATTSVTLFNFGVNSYASGSVFSLYGIVA